MNIKPQLGRINKNELVGNTKVPEYLTLHIKVNSDEKGLIFCATITYNINIALKVDLTFKSKTGK